MEKGLGLLSLKGLSFSEYLVGKFLKPFWTVGTLIRSFAGMNDPVVQGHFGPAYKTSSALFTDKWPLARMDPTMLLHIAFLRKALMAEIAIVGLNA